jgi:apolipoprotein N-acyltransferase
VGEDGGRYRPIGLTALSVFFGAGFLVSSLSALALAFPGSWLEPMWRLNPEARTDFARIGGWAVVLMIAVATACAGAAVGLWRRRRWGHRLATGVLAVNLLGDLLNAFVRGDHRTLIGLPIGGAMLGYLVSRRVRNRFRAVPDPPGG